MVKVLNPTERATQLTNLMKDQLKRHSQLLMIKMDALAVGSPEDIPKAMGQMEKVQEEMKIATYHDLLLSLATMEEATKDQLIAHILTNDVLSSMMKAIREATSSFLKETLFSAMGESGSEPKPISEYLSELIENITDPNSCDSCPKQGTEDCDNHGSDND